MWNLISVHLEIVLVSVQDSYTVCAKRTICSEMFWMHTKELLGDMGHVESRFGLSGVSVQDRCMVCTNCTMGSKIILDALNGTPM
jgi:hypothetical protein